MGFTHELDKVAKAPSNPHGYLAPRNGHNGNNGNNGINHTFPPGFQRISRSARGQEWP